jgi:hypothetical protein
VIVVPEGNAEDHTRKSEYYDSTFEYLKDIGLQILNIGTSYELDKKQEPGA